MTRRDLDATPERGSRSAPVPPAPAVNPRRWWALALLGTFQAALVLDDGVVNVALPALQRDLGFSSAMLAWSNNAYALTFGALLLAGGVLADRVGRLRVFHVGTALFGLGSLACVLVTTSTLFIAARIVQGVGAALASPAALALVTANFRDGRERNKALGWWGIASGIGGILGMTAAGILIGFTSWHWGFLINVPFVVLLLAMVRRFTPESRNAQPQPIDWVGTVLVTASLAALIMGLLRAAQSGTWTDGLLYLIVAGAAMSGFVATQRTVRHPMLPHGFFRMPNRTVGFIASLVMAGAFMAVFFALSLHMQNDLGFSPQLTGVALSLQPVVSFFIFPVAAGLTFKYGVKYALPFGLLLCAFALVLFVRLDTSTNYWTTIAPSLVLLGAGTSFAFVAATAAAFGGTDEAAGLASAVIDAAQQVGTAVGLALFVAVTVWAGRAQTGVAPGISAAFGWAGVALVVTAIFAYVRMEPATFGPPGEEGSPSAGPSPSTG